jgi:hypothetical protein
MNLLHVFNHLAKFLPSGHLTDFELRASPRLKSLLSAAGPFSSWPFALSFIQLAPAASALLLLRTLEADR